VSTANRSLSRAGPTPVRCPGLSTTAPQIAAATKMGAVHLTVADLGRSLDYYERALGLRVLDREDGHATLGADAELLVLVEEPGARPAPHHTGLFHFALLVPERRELARWLAHAARTGVELTGLSDHYVSEAIYLRDPDHHGIEIYADRPRELWEGQVFERMTTMPLDTDSLLGELDDPAKPFERLADGTRMGHVHLQVADIPETVDFYRNVLGFGLMAQLGDQAAFLSAGGYHHHIGGNTWNSRGAAPPPPGSASLRHATIVVPDEDERERVLGRLGGAEETDAGPLLRDPSGNALLLDLQT
jgi:catechol 2,3-dioxygenase